MEFGFIISPENTEQKPLNITNWIVASLNSFDAVNLVNK